MKFDFIYLIFMVFFISCSVNGQKDWRETYRLSSDVEIAIEGKQQLKYVDQFLDYKIIIQNKGKYPAKYAQVVGIAPCSLKDVSSTTTATYNPNYDSHSSALVWNIEEISPGAQIELAWKFKFDRQTAESFDLKAKFYAQMGNYTLCIAESILKVRLMVWGHSTNSWDTVDPVEVGSQTAYVIPVKNEGFTNCTKIWLVDQIPEQMELVSASGPTPYWHDPKKNTVIFEPLLVLEPGKQVFYIITCKAIKEGSAKNTAMLYYDQFTKVIIDQEGTSAYK